ncbi:MAG: histidinol dehydrogenase [Gammaproteobacteria bacterium]|jgi:histidinol dehydrogenase
MAQVQIYDSTAPDFDTKFETLMARVDEVDDEIEARVREIIARVRTQGDAALLELTARFDNVHATSAQALEVPRVRLEQALGNISQERRDALYEAARRVRSFHERQRQESWSYVDEQGMLLGQQVTALDRVGLYVPGGKAAYPSSVIMNAIPARVAGVGELIMVVPTPGGELNDLVLAAASVCEVDRVFTIGGAQAVAALAYGTQSVPRVDKIVGPGNIYVATAKRLVFGVVGIDMIAGPSEVVVVCDGDTRPDWVAMDLFAQAEHDEDARAILISPDRGFLDRVQASVDLLLPQMSRAAIIECSLARRGAFIHTPDLDSAVALVNRLAPEHLELSVADPDALLPQIRHAGAIFLGRFASEALGDYCAGPNHVLPTATTARFSSPLGVYDFQKRSSLIGCDARTAANLAPLVAELARGEQLEAHARSAELRAEPQNTINSSTNKP